MASFRYPSQGIRANGVSAAAFPLLAPDGSAAAPSYSFATATDVDTGFFLSSANVLGVSVNGAMRAAFGTTGINSGTNSLFWSASGAGGAADIALSRNGIGILDLHNTTSTSAQFNIMGTRTSASVYEALTLSWSAAAGTARIGTTHSGATARALHVVYGGLTAAAIAIPISINSSVHLAQLGSSSTAGTRVTASEATISAASGTETGFLINPTLGPSATSTMDARGLSVTPTINYAGGGAGRIQLIRLAPTNTALPTGLNAAITLSSTANALGGIHFHNLATEATDFEYFKMGFESNAMVLSSVAGGTGTQRGLTLVLPNAGLRIDGQTSAPGASLGTLANAPSAGDPDVWLPINVGGTVYMFPGWAA